MLEIEREIHSRQILNLISSSLILLSVDKAKENQSKNTPHTCHAKI